jgi:hypothetical protein
MAPTCLPCRLAPGIEAMSLSDAIAVAEADRPQ